MYTVKADCLNEVKTNPAVRGLISGTTYDAYLNNQLDITAGTKDSITYYRPYYVAAKFLEQLRSQQAIAEADGAKFTLLEKPIASLLALQASLDESLGLSVPPGFEAIALSMTQPLRFSTRSYPSQSRP